MVVYAEQRPGESEDFAESYQHGVVDFARRGQNKSGYEQPAAQGDEGDCGEQLNGGLMFAEVHIFVA